MIELLKRLAYQPEKPTMLGPYWSALGAGYVSIEADGRMYVTPAGRAALKQSLEKMG